MKTIWRKIFQFLVTVKFLFKERDGMPLWWRLFESRRKGEVLRLNPRERHIFIDGDSRIHFGETYLESGIEDSMVIAIGGNTCESNVRMLRWVSLYMMMAPINGDTVYITDIGGNDFLAGRSVDYVYESLMSLPIYGTKNLFYILPLPPGKPDRSDKRFEQYVRVRDTLREFRIKLKSKGNNFRFQLIDVSLKGQALTDNGWLREEYCAPDRIHHTELAYQDLYIPAINAAIEGVR